MHPGLKLNGSVYFKDNLNKTNNFFYFLEIDSTKVVRVVRLSSNAKIPTKATKNSAGFDVYAAYPIEIKKNEGGLVLTDLSIIMPPGIYTRIAPRSGLSVMYNIHVMAGVVDPDYRGNVGVYLFNHGYGNFMVEKGMRIAQLIFEKYLHDAVILEDTYINLTERGSQGFGSSGLQNIQDLL